MNFVFSNTDYIWFIRQLCQKSLAQVADLLAWVVGQWDTLSPADEIGSIEEYCLQMHIYKWHKYHIIKFLKFPLMVSIGPVGSVLNT